MTVKKWSVLLAVLVIVSLILTACPAPTATEKIVVQTQVVEKEKVVEKPVVQTQVVEKEKIVEKMITPTAGPQSKVLRVDLRTYPDIIDPQKSSFVNEIAHLELIYEGLTRLDKDLKTVPGAAEKWAYNADATELTFTLRKDLKYSDGSLLNAARFAYAIRRNINPETAGEYAQITDEIKGAPEWRGFTADAKKSAAENEKASADLAKAVEASVKPTHADGSACVGAKPADVYKDAACDTLKLTFSKPAPYFHTVMSLWVTHPAKEELITEGGENWWNSSKFQIGNGPYVLRNLEPFVRSYFVPNKNYWKGQGKVDIQFSFINDSAVAFEAYKNNELDIIAPGAEDYRVIQADATLKAQHTQYPGACTYAVMFHQLKEPFTDQKVREAFALALDRNAWVKDILQGLGAPTLTWIPPGFPGYDPTEKRWGFDPAAAKAAPAAPKYGSADKPPPIKATFSDSPRNRTRNEWLVAKWKEVLGVNITLDPVEATTYTALTKDIKTAPQMFILGWCADYPDPQNWMSVYWKTGAFGERIGYSNKDLDKMMDAADVEKDPAKRMQLYLDAQKKLTDGAPVAFMWNNVNQYLVKPWVKGIVTTPQDSDFPGSNDPLTIDIDLAAMPKR